MVPPPRLPAHIEISPRVSADEGSSEQDDLALLSGRRHLKARQRGVDRAALWQLVVTLPIALVSLFVVVAVFTVISPVLGALMMVAWLISGPLVFHRRTEASIARHFMGMCRPSPADARRLEEVWGEVTRRAGVRQETYELWIQERGELNATAAAGHIVGVTRHAMDRLPNSQLAAILAHELGHHVGGHTWAGMLADWYALPARTLGRWIIAGLSKLVSSRNRHGLAWGGCLSLLLLLFLYTLAFTLGMWWLVLLVAVAPLLISWLHRRAEARADDYACGLGFGAELMAVLAQEHRNRTTSQATDPWPRFPHAPPSHASNAHIMVKGAHQDYAARLRHLQRGVPSQGR
ncbi:M48 family metalloprotease [Embleya sp. NPDC020630]|uniref:M48 family metalloprotease n=1 Tax=Embleya sp. NPDC020630 TaxID=3363979 RepID=UPI0037BACA2F